MDFPSLPIHSIIQRLAERAPVTIDQRSLHLFQINPRCAHEGLVTLVSARF